MLRYGVGDLRGRGEWLASGQNGGEVGGGRTIGA